MAFRIQDLMMDVRRAGLQRTGLQMANPECTCQVTVKPGVRRMPEPEKGPAEDPGCKETLLPSCDCPQDCPPEEMKALAAELAVLREQLRLDLGRDA